MVDEDIDRFSARFGLTPAETRVLCEIIRGNGLLATAAKLNICGTTARTHVRRIFDKTGTKRQTELIHCFFECIFVATRHGARTEKNYRRLSLMSSVLMTPKQKTRITLRTFDRPQSQKRESVP